MTDLKIEEIRKLSQKANKSENYLQKNFLYKEEYEKFNLEIVKAANNGLNFVGFDFVDKNTDDSQLLSELNKNNKRIYLSSKGGQATYNMYEYPLYLISKGFKVEIKDSLKKHGYISKSYYISW